MIFAKPNKRYYFTFPALSIGAFMFGWGLSDQYVLSILLVMACALFASMGDKK